MDRDLARALSPLLNAFADAVVARVQERLAAPESDSYDSRGHLPPDVSRARFCELLRRGHVEGAEKRGRTWFVPRAAWDAYRARPRVKPSPAIAGDAEKAVEYLEAAGFRVASRGK